MHLSFLQAWETQSIGFGMHAMSNMTGVVERYPYLQFKSFKCKI